MATETKVKQATDAGMQVNAISIRPPVNKLDWSTIFGLILAVSLIGMALYLGGSVAAFLNVPAMLIVVGGTIAVTAVSYTGEDLGRLLSIMNRAFIRTIYNPKRMAFQLMDMATISKAKGVLSLNKIEDSLKKDPMLYKATQHVIDGYKIEELENVLMQEKDAAIERHKRSANIVRRASEVAPAMGLIGTLVGLVQMLSNLDDPSSIGPAMAVALLTTFYGAVLSTVFLAPMANKLDRNSVSESMIRELIVTSLLSISRQEHPRKLETLLNAILPPSERIRYFKT